MRNGVPYKIAFGDERPLGLEERKAMYIVFAIIDGGKFDWDTMTFKESK